MAAVAEAAAALGQREEVDEEEVLSTWREAEEGTCPPRMATGWTSPPGRWTGERGSGMRGGT